MKSRRYNKNGKFNMIFDKTKYKFLKFKKSHDNSFINYCKQKFF